MIQKLIFHLNSLNNYLDFQCRIKSENNADSEIIKTIVAQIQKETILIAEHFNMHEYGQAVKEDLNEWLASNCKDRPDFKKSRDTLKSPENGDTFFFIGPLRIANGSRASSVYKFECFLSKREEPQNDNFDYLYTTYPHPKNICQSSHLLNATSELLNGNNLVFFPENILASDIPDKQEYAVFFFNKFYRIFQDLTIPLCSKIGLEEQYTSSKELTEDETYKARCVWGYLHDYYHHIGPRAFDEHIKLKTKWFTGLIEEVKVDMQTFLTCIKDKNVPFGTEVSEFILLERLIRYPSEKTWSTNFDAGTGLFLQSYLFENKNLHIDKNQNFVFDTTNLEPVLQKLIEKIEEIERLPDEQYLIKAKEYVYTYLKKNTGNYFNYPEFLKDTTYKSLIGTSETH